MSTKTNEYTLFSQYSTAAEFPPAVLVCAADFIRLDRARQEYCKRLKSLTGIEPTPKRLSGKELTVDLLRNLGEEVFNLSLFSPRRLYVISGLEDCSAAVQPKLVALLSQLPADVNFFCSGKGSRDNQLYRFFKSRKQFWTLPDISKGLREKGPAAELLQWIENELQQAGANSYPRELPRLLAEAGEGDPDVIADMVARLTLFCAGEKISSSAFHQLFQAVPNPLFYELTNYCLARDTIKAEVLLEQLLNRDGKAAPGLVASLIKNFLPMVTAQQLLQQGQKTALIREQLGVNTYQADRLIAAGRRWQSKQVQAALRALLGAECRCKGSNLGALPLMSQMVQNLSK